VSSTRAASDCSISGTLADWGENSTSDIDMGPEEVAYFRSG
jgi:hypothetical protein